jgi:hypothetical protein
MIGEVWNSQRSSTIGPRALPPKTKLLNCIMGVDHQAIWEEWLGICLLRHFMDAFDIVSLQSKT